MEPETEEVLEIISHTQRREILKTILEEGEMDITSITGRRRIAYVHNHIPKLESAGLIEHREEDGLLVPGPEFSRFEVVWYALVDAIGEQ